MWPAALLSRQFATRGTPSDVVPMVPRSWLGGSAIVTAGECFVFPQRRPGAAEGHWKRLQMLFRRCLDRSTDEERCH